MHKVLATLGLAMVSCAYGQVETIHFKEKLVYELETKGKNNTESSSKIEKITFYNGDKYLAMGFDYASDEFEGSILNNLYNLYGKERDVSVIYNGMEGKYNFYSGSFQDRDAKYTFLKSEEKGMVNRVSCNYYDVLLEKEVFLRYCVDETSKVDIFSKISKGKYKGLILSLNNPDKNKGEETLILKHQSPIDVKINFDNDEYRRALAKYVENDTIVDSAVAVEDNLYGIEPDLEEEDYFHLPYKSEYKQIILEGKPELAIVEHSNNEKLMGSIPKFCAKIEEQISLFENTELKNALYHFLGQTCDLYLYPNTYNVAYKETLDYLRKSILEIEKLKPNLSKKDQENLYKLLENLD